MSDWWNDLPAAKPAAPEPVNAAGHTDAQIDQSTAQAIAAEPATPAKPQTDGDKLARFLHPSDAPVFTHHVGGPRGLVVICRDEAHAEAVGDAAAVAGIRVEPWTLDALCAVLAGGNGAPVARIAATFPGATVRKPRLVPIPTDEIPFGRWEAEATQ